MGARPAEAYDPRTAECIKRKARTLVGRYGYTPGDLPDLFQELALRLHAALRGFDAKRSGLATFTDRVLTTAAADLARHAAAQKRDHRRVQPLDAATEPPAEEEDARQAERRRGLALDVAWALAQLPEDLRVVALLKDHTQAEAVRKSGLSREQFRGRCHRAGPHLRAMGLAPESSGKTPVRQPTPQAVP